MADSGPALWNFAFSEPAEGRIPQGEELRDCMEHGVSGQQAAQNPP
jgi:hypothetical protein